MSNSPLAVTVAAPGADPREPPQQQAAGAVEGAGGLEGGPFPEAEHGRVDRHVEVEHHRQARAGLAPGSGQPARDEGLTGRREQEGIEVEAPRLQGQPRAPAAQVDLAAAGQPQGLPARIDLGGHALEPDEGAARLERPGQVERQIGAGGLGRRADHEAGCPLRLGDQRARIGAPPAAGIGRHEGDARIGLEARMRVAAARDLQRHRPVGGGLAADDRERQAAAGARDPPGPDERRRLELDRLGVELVGAAGRRDHRGQQQLLDVEILDREVAAAQAVAEPGRHGEGIALGHRKLDLGAADPRLGEAELALQERAQPQFGLDEAQVEAGLAGRVVEMQPIEAQARRGQQANVDAPFAADRQAEGPGDGRIDQGPMGRPVDEGRQGERRDEDQDDGARERGQEVTHRDRSTCIPLPTRRAPAA